MKPKVIVVAPWFGIGSGGAEIALLKIAEAMRDLGHPVEVFTSRSMRPYDDWLLNSEPDPYETYKGFAVRRFAVDETGFGRFEMVSQMVARGERLTPNAEEDFYRTGMISSELITALKAEPDDTLIIGGPYYQAMIHGVVAALPGRVVVMPAFHNEPPFYFAPVKRLVRDARALLFLTATEKAMTIAHHADVMTRKTLEAPVLSLPFIDQHPAPRADEPGVIGRAFGDYMLYVGRIDEGKNITQLMTWHHQVNEQRLKAQQSTIPLLMAGKGVTVKAQSPHVKVLGFVCDDEKRQLIDDALALVNLSLNESFSFVLFEAWQRDVPVVVHGDSTVLRTHIDLGNGGYHCRNDGEYASALRELSRPEMRAKLAENGRDYAERICDKDGFLRRLMQLMEIGS